MAFKLSLNITTLISILHLYKVYIVVTETQILYTIIHKNKKSIFKSCSIFSKTKSLI